MSSKYSKNILQRFSIVLLALTVLPLLNGCQHDEDIVETVDPLPSSSGHAIISTVASDFSSGATSVVTVDQPRTVVNDISPTISDITVTTDGKNIYRIERFNADNITKFSLENPGVAIWQYSTLDSGEVGSSNPHDFVVASDSKAYILRYGKAKAWVVNPGATTAADFKTGEIDLGAYDGDGVPNMDKGIIVDGKLFISMQALDSSWAPQQAYVAVIDIATDTEIATGKSVINGIPLPVTSPEKMHYSAATGKIYIQGSGRLGFPPFTAAEYNGGIITLDPNTYEINMIVDDGDTSSHPYGNIADLAIVSATKGYFVGYNGWSDNTLYSFNPTTGDVNPTAVANIFAKNIADIEVDALGKLWVASQSDFGVIVVDPVTDISEDQIISTGGLVPDTIVFTQ